MPSRWIQYSSERWLVVIALILSILFHIVLLGYANFNLSIFEPKDGVVEVRFSNPVKIVPPSPVVEASVEPEPSPPEPLPEQDIVESVLQPVLEPTVEQTAPPNLESMIEPILEPIAEPTEEPAPAQVTEAESDIEIPVLDETQPRALSFVQTEFDILRGIDGSKVGQTRIHFESKEDGTYMLESESEAKGIASLFISGKLVQRSEGVVTETGLRPSSFLYQFGGASKAQRATFDWDNGKITLETSKGKQMTSLPKDTQDLVSFMYQFMFVPPLQEMQLNITNGRRLKAYGYSFIGEEELSTKMGNIRTMHLENINDDGDEKNEIWLAVDYRYLPVKIRKTEKDGSVIEQVVTNLKTDILQ